MSRLRIKTLDTASLKNGIGNSAPTEGKSALLLDGKTGSELKVATWKKNVKILSILSVAMIVIYHSVWLLKGKSGQFEVEQVLEPLVHLDDGGWTTKKTDVLVESGPCNIPIVNAYDLTQKQFEDIYAYRTPLLIKTGNENSRFRSLCRKDSMLKNWGDAVVTLSSANTYSYGTKEVSLKDYIRNMIGPQSQSTLANETFYFFGYNDLKEWKDFFDQYNLPPYSLPGHSDALSFGLAGPGSGVPFHFHGPGFAETLFGRKRWFLTPHHIQPEFNPNKTTLQWFMEDYQRIAEKIDLHECTVSPGEIIYFPDKWWHATLNLDTSVFISTFLSP